MRFAAWLSFVLCLLAAVLSDDEGLRGGLFDARHDPAELALGVIAERVAGLFQRLIAQGLGRLQNDGVREFDLRSQQIQIVEVAHHAYSSFARPLEERMLYHVG